MKIAILATDNREHFKDYANPVPHFGAAPEALFQGFALLPDAEIHVISCVRKPMESPKKLANNIWYHPVLVQKIGWMSTAYQGCIRAVRKKLREIQPDIVHGQGTERECAISAVCSGLPNVVTIHGNMAEINRLFPASRFSLRFYQWFNSRLEDFALARTGGGFCNSAYTESLVSPRARRTWRAANPIRAAFFSKPAADHSTLRGRAILNIGVISPRKRQLEILRLAKELHREGHTFPFLFVGACTQGTAYGDAFIAEISKAEAAGYAYHLGTKTTNELIEILDASGAVIHFPSEEAFGLVVSEALARNSKFFGANVGGIADIADGVESAELYAVDDWMSLKKGIAAWLAQGCPKPTTPSKRMAELYHPEVIARRHLEIYREVLNSSR